MTGQYDWIQVKSIFAAALDVPPQQRAAFLDSQCAGSEALRAEVESLLAAHEEAGGFLSEPVLPRPAASALSPGDRLGVYTIVQKIDEGGMAAVYQAVRDDAQFRKLVAIKILKAGMDTQFILDRFQKEKQILAHFDHPNIAKLLDGGTTPEGRPYFVLEFIAGQPIDVYCRDRALSIDDRLRLIQRVCSAVEYAHQNLIVHRDLKPRNILVTDDGAPKLLDFGIAKILSDERDLTMTGLRPMTPEYASPEQIRGEPVSTVTDIYCLGVILYELLTGRRPFRGSPTELVRLVLETEPRRPSTLLRNPDPDTQLPCDSTQAPKWAGRLRGDLDNIVLKAMHPDPQRRYHSVGELSSDIDRYFAGLPVTAAGDDLAYRVKKFATRHRTGVVAAAVVVVSLSAGLIVAQHEASVARKQKAMSEQRAAEIRRLANSLIFDLHDAIQSLPGATPIRVTLMDRATQALDSLTNTAVDDPAIQLELAAAYRRLAEVQGEPTRANLGNLRASLASYRKAQSLLEGVRRRQPKDLDVARQLASVDWAIGSILLNQGDKPAAREVREKALELREWASHAPPQDLDSRRDEATAWYMRGNIAVDEGDLKAAREARGKSYEVWEAVLAAAPRDEASRYQVALAAKNLSAVEQRFDEFALAAKHAERARDLDQERCTASPQDASAQLDLSFDLSELAELAIRSSDLVKAADYYRQARRIREQLLANDPGNQRLKDRTAYIQSREGRVQVQLKHLREARAAFERALELRRELAEDKSSLRAQVALAESQGDLGAWFCSSGDRVRGVAQLKEALAAADALGARDALNIEDRESVREMRAQLEQCSRP